MHRKIHPFCPRYKVVRACALVGIILCLVALAPAGEAHTCKADGCGSCREGSHVHRFADGSLYCESIGDERLPAPSAAFVGGILILLAFVMRPRSG